jgi:hypothetical protein
MTVADNLRKICACARQPIEAMLDAAEELKEIREAASAQGLDWSQVKALLKAQIQDERDDGERVKKLVTKADSASLYAAMLGIVAEKQKTPPQSDFSHETSAASASLNEAEPPTRAIAPDDTAQTGIKSDGVVAAQAANTDVGGRGSSAVSAPEGGVDRDTSSGAAVSAESGQLDIPDRFRRDKNNWAPALGPRPLVVAGVKR